MRRLHTLVSVLSLLICLAALLLWLPSYRLAKAAYFNWRTTRGNTIGCEVESGSGCVALAIAHVRGVNDDIPVDRWGTFETDQTAVVPRTEWERIGFARQHQDVAALGMTVSIDVVGVPHWLIAAVCAVLPVQWLRRRLRARGAMRRQAAGECIRCGYNLRANTSGICPECGAACKAATPAGVSLAAIDGK